jgi:hypothetical protein
MSTCRYENFLGLKLFIQGRRLRDVGTIMGSRYAPNGVLTLTTETGKYSFYFLDPPINILENGDRELFGDRPRRAYIKQPR